MGRGSNSFCRSGSRTLSDQLECRADANQRPRGESNRRGGRGVDIAGQRPTRKTGKIVFLRAHDLGTGYGHRAINLMLKQRHPQFPRRGGGYGFQLRNDEYLPARQAMFSLLRDAFIHNLTAIADYLIERGRINGTAIRVALIRETDSGLQEFIAHNRGR
jgi:hypothetical protein